METAALKFYVLRTEPVQEIAAHPDTLAELVAALPKAEPQQAPSRAIGLASLVGLPLVPEPELRPGFLHLRPFPRAAPPSD